MCLHVHCLSLLEWKAQEIREMVLCTKESPRQVLHLRKASKLYQLNESAEAINQVWDSRKHSAWSGNLLQNIHLIRSKGSIIISPPLQVVGLGRHLLTHTHKTKGSVLGAHPTCFKQMQRAFLPSSLYCIMGSECHYDEANPPLSSPR